MMSFRSGFLIVKKFEVLYRSFRYRTPRDIVKYSLPQEGAEPEGAPRKYRGLDREPLMGFSLEEMAHLLRGDPSVFPIPERAATLAMHSVNSEIDWGSHLLLSMEDARDVYLTLGEPKDWEIIWVQLSDDRVKPPPQTILLGFEPTSFPEGYFSALCDCMCFPRWHGTDEEGALFIEYHARLNSHALFDSPRDAENFLRFYRSLDWTESGEYSIVEIHALSEALYEELKVPVHYTVIDAVNPDGFLRDTLDGMTWDIHLKRLPKDRKIFGIKALRDITQMGLAEAKALVEALPKIVVVVHVGELQSLKQKLLQVGFELEVVAHAKAEA